MPNEELDDRAKGWWERWWAIGLLMILSALPLLPFMIPPYPDIVGHIGRYSVQMNIETSQSLSSYYTYDFKLFGNMGVDTLIELLAPHLGILAVVKWTAVCVPPLTILGFALVAKQLLGRIPASIGFASILAFNFPYFFGFLNFSLAMALSLNVFALWIWCQRHHYRAFLWLSMVPLGAFLYVIHVFGWGLLGLFVFGYELEKRSGFFQQDVKSALAAVLATVPLWPPFFHMVLWRSSMSGGGIDHIFRFDQKIAAVALVLRDQFLLADIVFLTLPAALVVQAARRDDFRIDWPVLRLLIPATAIFVIMPGTLFGSAYADVRMVPYLLALVLISVRAVSFPGVVAVISFVWFSLRMVLVWVGASLGANQIENSSRAIRDLPPHSRLLQINKNVCSSWGPSRLQMIGAMHLFYNHGFTNATWDMGGANPLSITYDLPWSYRQDPHRSSQVGNCDNAEERFQFLLNNAPREKFDYILLVNPPTQFEEHASDRLIARTENTLLYEIVTAARRE